MKRIIRKILTEGFNDRITREDYLNKILEYLVDDTIIDFNENEIRFPFFPIPLPPSLPPIRSLYHSSFSEYCKDNYGLTEDEIDYVWKKYTRLINEKIENMGSINESVDNKKRYLDKIVQYMIDDTEIDYDEGEIKYPYYSNILLLHNHQLPFSVHSFRAFAIYCKNMYSLDIEEIQYVWKQYRDILNNSGYSTKPINESVDRRSVYLDKIVNFLVDDTIIDYDKKMIRYPSPVPSVSYLLLTFHNRPSPFVFIPSLHPHSSSFSKFIKGNYGLTNDEIDYVWEEYKNIINEKINNSGSINESVDRRSVYLDKIVDFLVDDTEVGTGWFNPPYYIGKGRSSAGRTGFRLVYLHTFDMLDHRDTSYTGLNTQLIYFDSYCKNNYGLDGSECLILWKMYMKKLYELYDWGF